VAHYQALRWQVPGGGEGLCWTVVRGLGEPVTVEQAVRRIGDDPATLDERPLHASIEEFPAAVVHVAQQGPAVLLLEVLRAELLRRASAKCWSVWFTGLWCPLGEGRGAGSRQSAGLSSW
jgi:hypothetical protein